MQFSTKYFPEEEVSQKIFFTSDTHWFHTNIINYSNRPYKNVKYMNEELINNWNKVVSPKDIVYHLGDVAMGGRNKAEELADILDRLNGTIRLLRGNHDSYVLKDPCRSRFEWVKDYYELRYTSPSFGRKKFCLMHYPLYSWNGAGRKDKSGNPKSIQLHGHCHGNIDKVNSKTTRMDVGVDSNNYTPIYIETVIKIMNQRKYNSVDHHNENTNYY